MKISSYDFRLNIAAQSPLPDRAELKTVSVRIGQPFYETLNSMAKVLGKSASGLAGELLEAMIIRFDNDLPELRPDLTIPDIEAELVHDDDVIPYQCTWKRISDFETNQPSEKSEDEIDEGVRRDVAQGLALQEDAKNGKAKI